MISPLKKLKDGVPYTRPKEIEHALEALSQLPIEEVARRAAITDSQDKEHLPTECVLHFVRKSKRNGDSPPYFNLFEILRKRVLGAVPVLNRHVEGLSNLGNSLRETDIQECVLDKFQELLCLDGENYEERLDFYEVRFNSALAALRMTVQRSVTRRESYLEPMRYEGDSMALSVEMEKAIAHLKSTNSTSPEDSDYRFRLLAAINSLPRAELQVIELLIQGKTLVKIAEILGCVEKTVRNRRDRAVATVLANMQEDVK